MLVKSKFLLVQNLVFLCFSWLNHESLIFWGSITPFAWFYPIIFSKRQNFCFLDLVMHVSGCTRTKERPIFDREYCTPFRSFLTLALFFFKVNLHARTTVEHHPYNHRVSFRLYPQANHIWPAAISSAAGMSLERMAELNAFAGGSESFPHPFNSAQGVKKWWTVLKACAARLSGASARKVCCMVVWIHSLSSSVIVIPH